MASRQCNVCGHSNTPEARFCANCGATLVSRAEPSAPMVAPSYPVEPSVVAMEYMGFWIRFGAAIIDGVILLIIWCILPILTRFTYGQAGMFGILIPLLYYWLFTGLKGQTLGKMLVGIRVVDAQGNIPGLGRAALREILGKLISTIVLYISFFWIAFDNNKQGWHDKLAETYVLKAESRR